MTPSLIYWTLAKIDFTSGNNRYTNTVMTSSQIKNARLQLSYCWVIVATSLITYYHELITSLQLRKYLMGKGI